VPVALDEAPSWSQSVYGSPDVPGKVTVDGLTSDAGNPARPGDVIHVTGTLTKRSTGPATDVVGTLDTPSGWTVTGGDAPSSLTAGDSATVQWRPGRQHRHVDRHIPAGASDREHHRSAHAHPAGRRRR
jgi:hypothetical protein